MSEITVYKCTRPDGTDFYSGKLDYAAACRDGKPVEVLAAAPAEVGACGPGIHLCRTPRQTIQFAYSEHRPWRWFEGKAATEDVIAEDSEKLRGRRFWPKRELALVDIFGPDFGRRIERVRAEVASWKDIPWLKPPREVADAEIIALVNQWREAITPWLRDKTYVLPIAVKVVRTRAVVAGVGDAIPWPWWRWYTRPYYVLRRSAWWELACMVGAYPAAALIELYRLGCMPIGYVRGEFIVYCPQ